MQYKYHACFWQGYETAEQLLISFKSAKNKCFYVSSAQTAQIGVSVAARTSSHGFTLNFCHAVSRLRERTAYSWNQHAAWLLSPDPTRPAAKQVHCVQNNLSGLEAKEGKVMPTFLIGHGCRTNWCSWHLLLLDQVFHQFWFNGLESLIKCWWSMPNIKMHYKSLTALIITLRIHSFS